MAKKTVASLRKTDPKGLAKVIVAEKSEKTGAYTFKEEFVPSDKVKDYLSGK